MTTDMFSAEQLRAGVVKRSTHLADGRELIYYDDHDTVLPQERRVDERQLDPRPNTATMRRDVFSGDWITYATDRQGQVPGSGVTGF